MRGARGGLLAWLPALAVAGALTVAAWAWLGRPVAMPPAPEQKVHCASYTPFRGAQTPFDPTTMIPRAQIEEDLRQLKPTTDCVRTYAVDQGLDAVVPVAAELGMQVLLGIWIGRDPAANEKQIAAAIDIARAHPETVQAIIVGNEVLLRGEQRGEALAEIARRVRRESGRPVTYADVWEFWLKAPPVLKDSVDYITIHVLPYWEDDPLPVSAGIQHLKEIVDKVRAAFPGREIKVGETGWPSAGRWREDAAPSRVNEARYLREFLVYAKSANLDYNFIEAFDQPWKRWQEGTAGGFWGLYNEDRTPKFSWFDPVSEYPDWPLRAAASLALGFVVLAFARFWRPNATASAIWASAFGAMLAGVALTLHFPHAWAIARFDPVWLIEWEWILECLIGVIAFMTAVLLIAAAIGGDRRATGGALIEGIAWLRHPWLRPDLRQMLAVLRLCALAGVATVNLGLTFDPRYRDVPIAAYLIPAVFFFAADLARGGLWRAEEDRREEAGLGLLLAGTAVYIFIHETPLNLPADLWCVFSLLLAAPALGAWRGLYRRLKTRSRAATRPTAASPAL
jgi:glucan 1,3-beta-glucosidase